MTVERNTTIILQQDASPFTTMFNDVLQGITNTAALGVYCYLASKPAGWNVNHKELQNHFQCGRVHINTCLRHLKSIGVLEVIGLRNNKGQLEKWVWNLKRHLPNPPPETTIRETHFVAATQSGNTATINKKNLEIKRSNKNIIGKKLNSSGFAVEDMLEDNPHEIPQEHIENWVANRKTHKVTRLVWNRINKNLLALHERGISPFEAFDRMVTAGWRSLELDYFNQQVNAKGGSVKASQWDAESVWNA